MEEFKQLIIDNWEVLFGGTGSAVVVALLAFFFKPLGNLIKGLFKSSEQPSPVSTGGAALSADHGEGNVQIGNTNGAVSVQMHPGISLDINQLARDLNSQQAQQADSSQDAEEVIKTSSEAFQRADDKDDIKDAIANLQKLLEAKEAEVRASLKVAAQAAKHIRVLAALHDTEKATQLDPDDG